MLQLDYNLFLSHCGALMKVDDQQTNLIHKGQCLCVCLSVCVFSIEIQTAGRIGTKFGTEVVLEGGGRFLSLNTFFNTYFESSRATPGNPS